MIIGARSVSSDGGRVVVSASVGTRELWFSVPAEYGDHVTDVADPFVVAVLLLAMKNREPLDVRGKLSEKLHDSLPAVMTLLAELIAGIKPVSIQADDNYRGRPSSGVVSGFSGGVDSFCMIADHMAERYRLTHLVHNKVGSHPSDHLFRDHFERLVPTARELGLPLLSIESNIDDFYTHIFSFQQTHTLRNVAAVLVLQSLFGRYLYASGYHYRDIGVKRWHDTAAMDPMLLPLLSTESLECSSMGSEYTRVEKTLKIAGVPESYKSLDVCVDPRNAKGRSNCSVCWKCCRTQLTLEIAGLLNRYREVFDIDAWNQVKPTYLRVVRSSRGNSLMRELDEFATERGYPMPSMPVSQLASVPRRLKETAYTMERKAMELAPRGLKDAVKKLLP